MLTTSEPEAVSKRARQFDNPRTKTSGIPSSHTAFSESTSCTSFWASRRKGFGSQMKGPGQRDEGQRSPNGEQHLHVVAAAFGRNQRRGNHQHDDDEPHRRTQGP